MKKNIRSRLTAFILALGSGNAKITVTTADGKKKKTITVNVKRR